MEPYEKVKLARSSDRPTVREYINALFPNSVELHGDRCFGDESAMVGGIGYLGKTPVTSSESTRDAPPRSGSKTISALRDPRDTEKPSASCVRHRNSAVPSSPS